MSYNRARTLRVALVAAAALGAPALPAAHADSTLTVTRSGGSGYDVATAAGTWKFTVTAISGRPAQLIVRIQSADGSETAWASDHPRLGQTFESYQLGAAGVNTLRATLWGGPHGSNDSVTLSVDAP